MKALPVALVLFACSAWAAAPTCKAAVEAFVKKEGGMKVWKDRRRSELSHSCRNAAWSAEMRTCVAAGGSVEALAACNAAEYERSPRRKRCDALGLATFNRTLAALERDKLPSVEAFRATKDQVIRDTAIHCATGPMSEADLKCREQAWSPENEFDCVEAQLKRQK